jgi:hypothetical protein
VSEAQPAPDGVLDCVRLAIARHLGIDADAVGPAARLGDDLAMDSLDVLAVIDQAGNLHRARLTLNHGDPDRLSQLADLGSLTVEGLAGSLVAVPRGDD